MIVSISVASTLTGRHVIDTTPGHTVSALSDQHPPLRVFIPAYLRVERHQRSAAALGGLQTITRTSEPPRSRTSALYTPKLGKDTAFGLPEAIQALPASQHILLQRSLLAALSRPRRKRKRRKRHQPDIDTKAENDLLISCFHPTSRPLPTTSPAFSSARLRVWYQRIRGSRGTNRSRFSSPTASYPYRGRHPRG